MIKVQVKSPKPLAGRLVIETIVAAMRDDVNPLLRREFAKTTATWKEQPTFTSAVEVTSNAIIGEVATDNKIYRFVSGGTRVRYAIMTPDFVAKTRPRVIGSGPGRGGVAFISRKHPRPGIEAREFAETIAKNQRRKIANILRTALKRGIELTNHAYFSNK